MSRPAPPEPFRKKTQVAEPGPRAATAAGIRALSSARVRTKKHQIGLRWLYEDDSIWQTKGFNDARHAVF
jgi:hypothetical protein